MKMIQANQFLHWFQIYKLYRQAFPRYERKPFSLIRSMHKKGKTDVWFFENNGNFAGFAITINGKNAILIDYLAIEPNKRGQGMGTEILQQLKQHYAPLGIFVEIESVFCESENLDERLQRKRFYLNNGMLPMHVMVILFGVEMELMGLDCKLNFEEYFSLYYENFGEFATKNVKKAAYPEIV